METEYAYAKPLVWLGTWKTPQGLIFNGFHVWCRKGNWRGVYSSCRRAYLEAKWSTREVSGEHAVG